jgi:hypothetical protein
VGDYLLDERTVIVKPGMEHVQYIAEHMRQADRDEVYALAGWSPLKAALFSVTHSDMALCAVHDGLPAVIWGAGQRIVMYDEGSPWLLGTPVIEHNAKRFLRQSILWRDELLNRYGSLVNVVDQRNVVSIRWLRWLGFTLDPPIKLGFEGRPFHRFHLEA